MNYRFILLLLLSVILEATITTLPLTFAFLLLIYIFRRDHAVFAQAFFSGLMLDILLVRTIGISSMVFILFLFVVAMYEKKFEAKTPLFVFAASFLGSLGYLWIFGYKDILLQAGVAAIFFSALFVILQRYL